MTEHSLHWTMFDFECPKKKTNEGKSKEPEMRRKESRKSLTKCSANNVIPSLCERQNKKKKKNIKLLDL